MRLYRFVFVVGLLSSLGGCALGVVNVPPQTGGVQTPGVNAAPLVTYTPYVFANPTGAPTVAGRTATPASSASDTPESPAAPTLTETTQAAITPSATYDVKAWQSLPVIPYIGPRAIAILKAGLAKGNNPRVFSKIGDCESQASWFLGEYDLPHGNYSLGSYQQELSPVLQFYTGSFSRVSLAARPGFTAASLMTPIWADKQRCEKNENPLACEYRLNHPSVAFIMLGSNDASNPKTFEGHMRQVIDYSITQGVLPILGTKADNVEGNNAINETIARLANEYGLPLWNYWRAVQPLPDHGLQSDGVHLTYGTPHFDDPQMMQKAWPVRNLNALEILKRVMDQVQ